MAVDSVHDRQLADPPEVAAPWEPQTAHGETHRDLLIADYDLAQLRRQVARCHELIDGLACVPDSDLVGRVVYLIRWIELLGGNTDETE